MPPLTIFTVPLSVALLMMRSRALPCVRSSAPVNVTPSRKLLPLLLAWNEPVPLTLITPLSLTPLCTTVLPAPAMIWLPLLELMLVDSSSVPPLMACSVPLLMTLLPPPSAGATMFSVPPLTSAEIRPLLVSTLLPPVLMAVPMLPWPRTTTLAPSVVVPVPSMARRAPASLRLMTTVPLSVWLAAPDALSRLRMPPLAMFTAPLSVALLMMRSRELPWLVMSSAPVNVTPSRKLLPLLLAWKEPVPLTLMTPLSLTPLCATVLPAPAMIWPLGLDRMLVDSSSVAPLMARRVPLLMKLLPPPLAGATMFSVPPLTSAEIRPLLVSTLLPPTLMAVPMLPWPRTVTPEPSVVVPVPSIARRAPASLRLMTTVPLSVWLAAPDALSRLRMPPLAMFTAPLSVALLMMRSRELPWLVMSSTPVNATPSRKLLALLLVWKEPVPLTLITPLSLTPLCATVLPAPAMIWLPVLEVMLVDSSR